MNHTEEWGYCLLRPVRITRTDGTPVRGLLDEIRFGEDGEVVAAVVDNTAIPASEISDLSMTGRVTDYHTFLRYGEIDGDKSGRITFRETDIPDAEDRRIIMEGAYDCTVAAHLYIAGENNRVVIAAKDVRLLEKKHRLLPEEMSKEPFLFRFTDGTCLAGTLAGEAEAYVFHDVSGGSRPLLPEEVEHITRAPALNDLVEAVMRDGTVKTGMVINTNESNLVLRGGRMPEKIAYRDIRKLFYNGTVFLDKSVTAGGKRRDNKCVVPGDTPGRGSYPCKPGLFQDRAVYDLLTDGSRVKFRVAVCNGELIATEIVLLDDGELQEGEELVSGTGITVYFPDINKPGSRGYLAEEYLSAAFTKKTGRTQPDGTASFTIARISFKNAWTDAGAYRYEAALFPGNKTARVIRAEQTERFDRTETAYAYLDREGVLHTVSYGVFYLRCALKGRVMITKKDGTVTEGILSACDGVAENGPDDTKRRMACITAKDAQYDIPLDDIRDVRFFGIITKFFSDSGNGFVGFPDGDEEEFYFDAGKSLPDRRTLKDFRVGAEISFRIAEADRKKQNRKEYPGQAVDLQMEQEVPAQTVQPQEGETVTAYILKYIANGNYGFMIGEDELEEHLRTENRAGNIYFQKADIIDDGGFTQLNTFINYYRVSCVIRRKPDGSRTAKQIRIGSVHVFKSSEPAVSAVQKKPKETVIQPPKSTEAVRRVEETVPLETYGALPENERQEIGLINIHSSYFGRINRRYVNRKYSDAPDAYAGTVTVTYLTEQTRFEPEIKLKTAKFSYLVRYVPAADTDDAGQPFIDYNYPVEVLQQFLKTRYVSIDIGNDNALHVVRVSEDTSGETYRPGMEEKLYTEIPELMTGENLIVCPDGEAPALHTYQGEEQGRLLFADGTALPKAEAGTIWRFGIVTEINQKEGIVRLNGVLEASFSVMDQKLYNILKSQNPFSGAHVVFRHDADTITELKLIPDEWLRLAEWEDGTVSSCNKTAKKAGIRFNYGEEIFHIISVKSEPLVSRRFRDDALLNDPVYVRKVRFPFGEASGGEQSEIRVEWKTVTAAVDVRCMFEEAKVCYDSGKDLYYAERNQTETFLLEGSRALLEEKRGEERADIRIEISPDGRELVARLLDEEPEEELVLEELGSDEGQIETLPDTPLAQLLLEETDLKSIPGFLFEFDANGLPKDVADAQKGFDLIVERIRKRAKGSRGSLWNRGTEEELLAMAKLALNTPGLKISSNDDKNTEKQRRGQAGNWLRYAINKRQNRIGKDAELSFTELNSCLSILLRYVPAGWRPERLYRLFLRDFYDRNEALEKLRVTHKGKADTSLRELLSRDVKDISDFIGRLLLTDKTGFEIMRDEIREQESLAARLKERAEQIEASLFRRQEVKDVADALRNWYETNKRRFARDFADLYHKDSVSPGVLKILTDMQALFLNLICAEERDRFNSLYTVCSVLQNYMNRGGFVEQERELTDAYRLIVELEEDLLRHPGKETLELLICNEPFGTRDHILSRIRQETENELNRLYEVRETLPHIRVVPNAKTIGSGESEVFLIVSNGDGTGGANPRPASEVRLLPESYTEGVSVPAELSLPPGEQLVRGNPAPVGMKIGVESRNTDVIRIGCAVSYRMTTRFAGGKPVQETIRQEAADDTLIELQIGDEDGEEKRTDAENPYEAPAKGNPITDKTMFFGREEEKRAILDHIATREEDGRYSFNDGATVIVYGQKKCGKTSLVNQIRNTIREEAFGNRAISISIDNFLNDIGGADALYRFQTSFYGVLLNRIGDEIYENHPDVVRMMEEHDIRIPDPFSEAFYQSPAPMFDRFLRSFHRADGGKHTIVLFIDEFTQFTMTILGEIGRTGNGSLQSILGFIKTFSQMGFVQVIIGHEAMMRALDRLNVINHTAEFAKTLEITALDEAASRDLIKKPMEQAFGFDVYGTPLGGKAVERLLALSGRHPTYLMRLCNQMFLYYTDPEKCPGNQILVNDVEAMCRAYTAGLQLDDFESLLVEDGDSLNDAEDRDTYKYLSCAARLSHTAIDHMADIVRLGTRLKEEHKMTQSEIDTVRNLLERRHVISVEDGGRIRINTGLFIEYYMSKYGRS